MATSVGSFVLFSNYLSPLHSTPTHESAAQLQKVGLPLQSKRHHGWVKQLSKWTSGLSTARSDSSRLKSTGLWTILQINSVHPNWMAGRSVLWGSVLSRQYRGGCDLGGFCPRGVPSYPVTKGGGLCPITWSTTPSPPSLSLAICLLTSYRELPVSPLLSA